MKTHFMVLLTALLLVGKGQAQTAAEAAAVGAFAVAATILVTTEIIQEQLEVEGTRYLLANHPSMEAFNLKVMDWNGKNMSDAASTRLVVFKVKEVDLDAFEVVGRKVLLMFTSPNWITEEGVNFDKVRFDLLDQAEWSQWMMRYIAISTHVPLEMESRQVPLMIRVEDSLCETGTPNHFQRRTTQEDADECYTYSGESIPIERTHLRSTELDFIDAKGKDKFCLPLYQVSGDTYMREQRTGYPVLVRNEKAMGLFDPQFNELVLLKTRIVNDITDFLRID